MADAHSGDRTLHPRLVLQRSSPGQTFLFQLVGIEDGETALQGDMTQVQGTVPTGVLEGESFEDDMMDRVFFGAADDDQPFDTVVLFGGAQQETAVAALSADDGLGPWMLKLQMALRFLEGDIGGYRIEYHDWRQGKASERVHWE